MKQESKPCAECKPHCRIEIAMTRQAALSRYGELFKQGRFPTMCQQHNGVFHVCHAEEQERASMPRRANQATC